MKISSIPQLYRNVRRWQEILAILRRYGLADWLSHLKFDFIRDWMKDEQGVPLSSYSREKRIRLALTELGPTFIKLGQVLSQRPDLIGPELAQELTSLQSQLPATPGDEVLPIIEAELGAPASTLFKQFNADAIASASIGQVHEAALHDGTSVVVKVQHPGIADTVHEDLEVLAGLATLAGHIEEFEVWKPAILVEQLSKSLRRELNFTRELQNLQVFRQLFAATECLTIPEPYPKLSSTKVMTMQRLDGVAVDRVARADKEGNPLCDADTRQRLAKTTAEIYMEMIFTHGVYHADPHPGNVIITADEPAGLGLLDFGMVGRIDDRLRETIEGMLLAIASNDTRLLTTLIKRVGNTPPKLDDAILSIDVADLIATYGSQPLESFDLSGALNDVTDIMHRHQISLPPQTSLLIKTMISLEGSITTLSPQFSLLEVMRPFFRKMWLRRFSPKRQFNRMRRIYVELESLLETLPSQISGVMQLVQEGRLDVHLAHKGLAPSVNRLVLGMLFSSVFLGSSMLLAFKVPPILFAGEGWLGIRDLSLLGLIGYGVSMIALLRLLTAIYRSGHLEQSDRE